MAIHAGGPYSIYVFSNLSRILFVYYGHSFIILGVIYSLVLQKITMATSTSVAEDICYPKLCSDVSQIPIYTVKPFNIFHPAPIPCCSSCACDSNKCHVYGSECNETTVALTTQLVHVSTVNLTCELLQLRPPITPMFPVQSFRVYATMLCPPNFHSRAVSDPSLNATIDRCEFPSGFSDLGTRLPVSDSSTGLTYGNMYCAQCNNVSDQHRVFWLPKIQCNSESYWPKDYDTIVTDIERSRGCNIIYEMPTGVGLSSPLCDLSPFDNCNVYVQADCYTNLTSGHNTCSLAGARKPSTTGLVFPICPRIIDHTGLLHSYAMLFKYTPPATMVMRQAVETDSYGCSIEEFYDSFKKVCRTLVCITPRILQNETCVNPVETLSGVHVKIFIKITPFENLTAVQFSDLGDNSLLFGAELMANHSVDIYEISLFETSVNGSIVPYYVLHVVATILNYDAFDARLMDDLLETGDKSIRLGNTTVDTEIVKLTLNMSSAYNEFENQTLVLSEIAIGSITLDPLPTQIIQLLSTSGCPLVELGIAEFDMDSFPWGIWMPDFNKSIAHWHIVRVLNGSGAEVSFQMCVDRYQQLISSIGLAPPSGGAAVLIVIQLLDESLFQAGVLSLVCTCLSVLCASLTVLTYALFRDMRTQAGVNNIALCVNLILAQMLFQFGIGLRSRVPHWACAVVGIQVHFFWLSTVMWMNVCCIHSFEVFWTIDRRRDNRVSVKRSLLYTLYATTLAACPVVINIISYKVTGNHDSSYGHTVCYLSNNKIIGLTFALPIGIIIGINMILFSVIVVKIRKSSFMNPISGKQRQFFGVYARLSVLTGFLCLFCFIYMYTQEPWLQYVFIFFNASQGVFIFISFVCNKSCIRKYLGLVTGSAASSTATTRVSDNPTRPSRPR